MKVIMVMIPLQIEKTRSGTKHSGARKRNELIQRERRKNKKANDEIMLE